jgi:hypothetical protein
LDNAFLQWNRYHGVFQPIARIAVKNPALDHHAASDCPNCSATVSGNFCHECGQETVLHPPSTGEFFHEFVGHYVALEGKLWQTLKLLLLKPGQLTIEYMAGRRVRYVQPLRVYLTFSLIFFAVAKYMGEPSTRSWRIGTAGIHVIQAGEDGKADKHGRADARRRAGSRIAEGTNRAAQEHRQGQCATGASRRTWFRQHVAGGAGKRDARRHFLQLRCRTPCSCTDAAVRVAT